MVYTHGKRTDFPLPGKRQGQEYCKEPHKRAENICFKQVYVGLAIALKVLSC
jgi:hypothetical protein